MSWVPLESNPDVMNKYLTSLGVPDKYQVVDVLGLDKEMLAIVPQPVLALMLLFPITDKYEEYLKQQEEKAKGDDVSDKVFFVKQTIRNSCGTIALIHSVANNTDKICLADGHLKSFITEASGLDADQRGELLLKADGIANVHQELAQEGQSEAPSANESVNYHFIAFVHCDGGLYELDGRKSFPIRHGNTTADTILQDAAKVCEEYIQRDPGNLTFSVVAFAENN